MAVVSVTYVDGTVKTGEVKVVDLAVFERTYGVPWIDENEKPEYAFFVAWRVLTRTGQETRTFDEFLEDCDGYEVEAPVPLDA